MAEPTINWDEVQEALNLAESLKNHYRFADRLQTLVSVVNRSKYLMEEANKQQRAAEGAAREARDELNRVTTELAQARTGADLERERIAKVQEAARESASSAHANWAAKLDQVQASTKAAQIAHQSTLERLGQAAKARADQLEAEHRSKVETLQRELDALVETKAQAEAGIARLKQQADTLLAGLR